MKTELLDKPIFVIVLGHRPLSAFSASKSSRFRMIRIRFFHDPVALQQTVGVMLFFVFLLRPDEMSSTCINGRKVGSILMDSLA